MPQTPRIPFEPELFEKAKLRIPVYDELADRYRNDADLRSRIDGGDVADSLSELGIAVPPDIEVRIFVNTPDTFHVIMPPDPNVELSDETLSMMAGGKSAGSAGSAGTAGSVSSVCGTYGTVSSASSAGSAGSAS